MGRYILRRLILLVFVLLGVTLITFLLLQLIPGGPVQALLGDEFDATIAAAVEEAYGLDKPLFFNFSTWMASGARTADYMESTSTMFTVTDASVLQVGQEIRVGNERMKIQQIIGDKLMVQRGWGRTKNLGHRRLTKVMIRGFNSPFDSQYFRFLFNALRLDFGRSIKTGEKVFPVLLGRFAFTFQLSLLSLIISVIVGILAGVISATRQYSLFDNVSMLTALAGISTPIFVTGIILILVFAVTLPRSFAWWPTWLKPAAGRFVKYDGTVWGLIKVWGEQPGQAVRHLIMPALALGIYSTAVIARMTRTSMLEVVRQDYVRTARAYGVMERIITYKHALKNALIPVVTVIGLQFGINLGGAVLTETVFSLPGVGRYIVEQGILARDYPIVQAGILLVAFVFILVNLITDLTYAFLDPRIRYR